MTDGYDHAEFWMSQARRAEMRGRLDEARAHRAHARRLRRTQWVKDFAVALGIAAMLCGGWILAVVIF
jgi:ferric-dicitrate binding protein FerR (iron transport regulator)